MKGAAPRRPTPQEPHMDILDTRDLIKRRNYLRDEVDVEGREPLTTDQEATLAILKSRVEAGHELTDEEQEEHDGLQCQKDYSEPDEDDVEELKALEELIDSLGSEARHGITLISEDDFEQYARQFAEDIGAISDDAKWPYTCIDWKEAANELAQDYSTVTFQGTDYYYNA